MTYASVEDIRVYNGWYPIQVSGETLTKVSSTVFRTGKKPLVDYDYDGDLTDDVRVLVDGVEAAITSIDAEKGEITLQDPVAEGSTVTGDYWWHPFGDNEIKLAIAAAEAEIEATTGIRYESHSKTEWIDLRYGSEFSVSEPIISVTSITIYDAFGNATKSLTSDEYEIIDAEGGRIRLKDYVAGVAVPPWYLLTTIKLKIEYIAGYEAVPENIKQATILIATYELLLRIQRQVSFSEEYGQTLAAAFKTPQELTERLEFLRAEIKRVKEMLPRRVAKA